MNCFDSPRSCYVFFSFCGFQSLLLRLNNLFSLKAVSQGIPSHTRTENQSGLHQDAAPLFPSFVCNWISKPHSGNSGKKKGQSSIWGNWGTGINIIHIKKFESISLREEASPYPRGSSCTRLSIETQGGGPFFARQPPIENRVGKRRKRN